MAYLAERLPKLRRDHDVDLVVANAAEVLEFPFSARNKYFSHPQFANVAAFSLYPVARLLIDAENGGLHYRARRSRRL